MQNEFEYGFSATLLTASAIAASTGLLGGPVTGCMFSCDWPIACAGFSLLSNATRKLKMSSENC